MAADLQAPAFTDDNAAREAMEAVLWPDGSVCPRCRSLDRIGKAQLSQLISHDACKPLMLLGRRGAKSICGAKASGRGAGFAWLLRI